MTDLTELKTGLELNVMLTTVQCPVLRTAGLVDTEYEYTEKTGPLFVEKYFSSIDEIFQVFLSPDFFPMLR